MVTEISIVAQQLSETLVLNVSGRLLMVQKEASANNSSAPQLVSEN